MFGTNPIRKQDLGDGNTLRVQEIFKTIQGEGPHAGRPAIFIRLAGCLLRCSWCDTDFESNYNNVMTLPDIFERISTLAQESNIDFVVITGGEPLIQQICPLLQTLQNSCYDTQIETAGPIWIPGLEYYCDHFGPDFLVCSPKTPVVHAQVKNFCTNWKFIIDHKTVDADDGLPCENTQRPGEINRVFRPAAVTDKSMHDDTIWVQPCDVADPIDKQLNMQAAIRSCLQFGYRLSMQIHKIIDMP